MKIGNLEVYGVIYKITNKINGKVYIGQTTNGFNNRYCEKGIGVERVYKRHKALRDNGYRYNKHLFDSFEKYRLINFEVCECFDFAFSKKELDIKEKCWILYYNSYKCGYNNNLGGGGNSGFEGLKGDLNPSSREVVQLDLDGKYIKEWNCIKYVTDELGIGHGDISSVCSGNKKSAGGYIWVYSEEYEQEYEYKYSNRVGEYNKTPVICLSLEGCFINEYSSISEAVCQSEKLNVAKISQCCKNNRKSHGGFMWLYKSQYNKDVKYEYDVAFDGKEKPVVQLSINGDFINEFISVKEASDRTNSDRNKIASCCRGEQYTSNEYIWIYKSEYDSQKKYSIPTHSNSKNIIMYLKTGEVISEFKSLKNAEEETGIKVKSISNCLRGLSNTAGGYVWKYSV